MYTNINIHEETLNMRAQLHLLLFNLSSGWSELFEN